MVTVVGKTAEGLGVYRGLSTDLPITPAPKNGSRFFAIDNGKTYWYDADSETWEGYAGGGSALGALSDVSITSPAAGEILSYNGTKWVNSLSYSETSGATLTLYVDGSSGSDSNDGLTSGTAFATISKALAVPDNRYKMINVSGMLTESITTDGANCRIYIASGTATLTLDRSLSHASCRIEIANSTTAQAVINFADKIWYSADFYIHGWSANKITVSGLPYMVGSQLNIDYCEVAISSVVTTINSSLAVTNSNFTMGGYYFSTVASNYYLATVTLTGCGTNLFNNCRALLCCINGLTHDATNLVNGTAVINYKNITGSVATTTYNTSLIV